MKATSSGLPSLWCSLYCEPLGWQVFCFYILYDSLHNVYLSITLSFLLISRALKHLPPACLCLPWDSIPQIREHKHFAIFGQIRQTFDICNLTMHIFTLLSYYDPNTRQQHFFTHLSNLIHVHLKGTVILCGYSNTVFHPTLDRRASFMCALSPEADNSPLPTAFPWTVSATTPYWIAWRILGLRMFITGTTCVYQSNLRNNCVGSTIIFIYRRQTRYSWSIDLEIPHEVLNLFE